MATTVLYVDYDNIPAPLSCSYYINDHLTSIRSVACEVDSAYCPQCFSYQDAYTATKSDCKGRCVRASCKACPICLVPLQVVVVEATPEQSASSSLVALYHCGYCRYSSVECGVYVTTTSTTPGKDVLDQLHSIYQSRLQYHNKLPLAQFHSLVEAWNDREQSCREIQQIQRTCDPTAAATLLRMKTKKGTTNNNNLPNASSSTPMYSSRNIHALDQRCRDSTEQILASYLANVLTTNTQAVDNFTLSTEPPAATPSCIAPSNFITTSTTIIHSRVQQGVLLQVPTNPSILFPLPIPMLPKFTKRCTMELTKGKPGILIKSKLNPLDGDTTSSRTGHGQWWKKDCSAIHEVPRLTVVQYGLSSLDIDETTTQYYSFLLKIHNPLLNPVQVRLSTAQEKQYPPLLENIFLDAFNPEKQSEMIHIINSASITGTNSSASSTWIEMDAAQELQILDIYTGDKNKKEDWMDTYKGWDAKKSIQRYMDSSQSQTTAVIDEISCRFVVLGVDKDTAWVEWTGEMDTTNMVSLAAPTERSSSYRAIPLTMQVLSTSGAHLGIISSSTTNSTKPSNPSHGHGRGEENNILTFYLLTVWQSVGEDLENEGQHRQNM